jgi:glutathione synthase/RimK-type ligase-like ATP-grasp enzyme
METGPSIGVIGSLNRAESRAVMEEAARRGAGAMLFDLSKDEVLETLDLRTGRLLGLPLEGFAGWYVNTMGNRAPRFRREAADSEAEWEAAGPLYHEYVGTENRRYERRASLLMALEKMAPVVNPLDTYRWHATKVFELHALAQAGFRVPEFVSSNDPEALKAFIRSCGGRALYKPHVGGTMCATLVDAAVIGEVAPSLRLRPVLLQRFIPGFNIRAYVAGDRFVGAARILQDEAVADSRVAPEGVEVWDLPEAERRTALDAARHHGLAFSGIDFQYHAGENRYYLLEANSSPMFVNFERLTGVGVTEALVRLLLP